jgi:hypothetical protein
MPRPDSSVVERGPEKAGVGGSIPSLATTTPFQRVPSSLTRSITPYFSALRVPDCPSAFLDSAGSLGATLGANCLFTKSVCPQMPLTDVRVRNFRGGEKPLKPSAADQITGLPEMSKPKNRTRGVGATPVKTDDEPKFIVTTKPYKMADGAGLYLEVDPSGESIGDSNTDGQEKRSESHWGVPRSEFGECSEGKGRMPPAVGTGHRSWRGPKSSSGCPIQR